MYCGSDSMLRQTTASVHIHTLSLLRRPLLFRGLRRRLSVCMCTLAVGLEANIHYARTVLVNGRSVDTCTCIRKPPGSNNPKWFKFDDGDVTEAKIEDEEVSTVVVKSHDYHMTIPLSHHAGVQSADVWR